MFSAIVSMDRVNSQILTIAVCSYNIYIYSIYLIIVVAKIVLNFNMHTIVHSWYVKSSVGCISNHFSLDLKTACVYASKKLYLLNCVLFGEKKLTFDNMPHFPLALNIMAFTYIYNIIYCVLRVLEHSRVLNNRVFPRYLSNVLVRQHTIQRAILKRMQVNTSPTLIYRILTRL